MTDIVLYDLAGVEDERRFSPYCWRVRMALHHKGLAFKTVPWRFTEKERIAFSGGGTVPVLVCDGTVVRDSWAIAEYLEAAFPGAPSLFGGDVARAVSRFVDEWTKTAVVPAILQMIVADIHGCLHEKDRDYFRASREARLGTTLEQCCAGREQRLEAFRAGLAPLRKVLELQPFLAGERPAWADYIAFSPFQWARSTSRFQLLDEADPVRHWRDRILDLYGAAGRATLAYPA